MTQLYIGDAVRAMLKRNYDAVRTIDDLKDRCYVDEDSGCWHWKQGKTPSGAAAVKVRVRGKREQMVGRKAAFILARCQLPPEGHRVFAAPFCKSRDCVNPDHCRTGTAAQQGAAIARTGELKRIPSKVRANRATARRNAKLTMEQARQIRASSESGTVVGRRFGVSSKTVWRIRHNILYKEVDNVLATADVFAWAQNQRKAA